MKIPCDDFRGRQKQLNDRVTVVPSSEITSKNVTYYYYYYKELKLFNCEPGALSPPEK
jgi:hypothetical protein